MRGLLLTGCVALSIGVDDGGQSVDAGGWNGQPVDGQQGIFQFGVRVGDQLEAASSVTGVFGNSTASLLQAEAEGTHGAAKQTIKALTTILDSLVATPDYAAQVDGIKAKVDDVKTAVAQLKEAHNARLKELEDAHKLAMEEATKKLDECNEAKDALEASLAGEDGCTKAVEKLDAAITEQEGQSAELAQQNRDCMREKCAFMKKINEGKHELEPEVAEGTLPVECAKAPADDQTMKQGTCVIVNLTWKQATDMANSADSLNSATPEKIQEKMDMNGWIGKITEINGQKCDVDVKTPTEHNLSEAEKAWLTVVRNDANQACPA